MKLYVVFQTQKVTGFEEVTIQADEITMNEIMEIREQLFKETGETEVIILNLIKLPIK